jgi:RNA polymerase sigma factor (sigma-70 family)
MNRAIENDRKLLSECLAGDRQAAEAFVRRFSDLVYRSVRCSLLARNVAFNREDVEDLHNTVFLRLFEQGYKKLRQYRGINGCSIASWIRMITVRTVLDHLRKKGIYTVAWQKRRVCLDNLPELRAAEGNFWPEIDNAERERLLEDGMQRLPPRDRLFLKLHFEQGFSVTEVAETMQLSINNAYTVKHRAIEKLKSSVALIRESNP